MTRLLRLLAAGAAAVLLVAACGGGDGDDTAAPTAPTSAAATTAGPTAGPTTAAPTGAPSTSAPAGGEVPATATITIKDFRYGAPLTVKPGTTITVVNRDVARHDVVADQNGLFRTELLGQGEKQTFTAPTTPGSYTFSCSVHANMTGVGTLIVQA